MQLSKTHIGTLTRLLQLSGSWLHVGYHAIMPYILSGLKMAHWPYAALEGLLVEEKF